MCKVAESRTCRICEEWLEVLVWESGHLLIKQNAEVCIRQGMDGKAAIVSFLVSSLENRSTIANSIV